MARSIPGLTESLISMIMRTRGVTREQAIEIIGMSPDSDTASLADGLTGAPQDDITPEPVAGETPQSQQAAPLPPSRQARPSDTPLAPPEVMTQADIDYVNSLPQNSPEAMARKQKRWAKSDADMVDFANRLGLPGAAAQLQEFDRQAGLYPTQSSPSSASGYQSDLPPGLDPNHPRWGGGDPARVQQLMDANPGAFFGPGELTPEQEQHKKRMLSNRKSYYDQRYYAQTPDGKPVFQPVQEEFRVPYDPDKMPQATVPETGNAELGVPAYDKFEYTDDARRMRDGEDTASVMAGGSEMNLSLSEQRQAQQLIRARAVRIARERGEDPAKVAEELMASSRLYRDPATGRLGLANGDDTFYKNRKRETDDYALRRERVRQRGLMGLLPSQSALSNNVVEARRILGDPDATDEERLAAKYWLSPEAAAIDLARAQNPPKGDGAQSNPLLDEQATIMRQQRLNEAAEKGAEAAKGRTRRSTDIDRSSKRRALASRFEEGSSAQLAALAAFDDAWPLPGEAPPSAPGRRSGQQGKDRR